MLGYERDACAGHPSALVSRREQHFAKPPQRAGFSSCDDDQDDAESFSMLLQPF